MCLFILFFRSLHHHDTLGRCVFFLSLFLSFVPLSALHKVSGRFHLAAAMSNIDFDTLIVYGTQSVVSC